VPLTALNAFDSLVCTIRQPGHHRQQSGWRLFAALSASLLVWSAATILFLAYDPQQQLSFPQLFYNYSAAIIQQLCSYSTAAVLLLYSCSTVFCSHLTPWAAVQLLSSHSAACPQLFVAVLHWQLVCSYSSAFCCHSRSTSCGYTAATVAFQCFACALVCQISTFISLVCFPCRMQSSLQIISLVATSQWTFCFSVNNLAPRLFVQLTSPSPWWRMRMLPQWKIRPAPFACSFSHLQGGSRAQLQAAECSLHCRLYLWLSHRNGHFASQETILHLASSCSSHHQAHGGG